MRRPYSRSASRSTSSKPKSLVKNYFKVDDFTRDMNVRIRLGSSREVRLELIAVLENVLRLTGNMWGFHALSVEDDSLREYY